MAAPERPTTRWMAETGGRQGGAYAARFRRLAAGGVDLHGEARFLDGLLRGVPTDVLDAGTGTGRVAVELARRGHRVTGLDVDPSMLGQARGEDADVTWVLGDLLDAPQLTPGPFGLVAAPGNVVVYLADGTGPQVVAALAEVLAPGGLLVAGFAADRHVGADEYERWCTAAAMTPLARYAGWDGEPWQPAGDYLVAVHRR